MQGQLSDLQAMVKELCRRGARGGRHDLPEELFRLFTELLDSDLSEESPASWSSGCAAKAAAAELDDLLLLKARLARMIEAEIARHRPDPAHARPPPPGGPGRPDRRGQDDDHRQAGGQLPPARRSAASA